MFSTPLPASFEVERENFVVAIRIPDRGTQHETTCRTGNTSMRKTLTTAAVMACLAAPGFAQSGDLKNALQNYSAAWASRDVDSIVSLHTDDSEFRLFVARRTSRRFGVFDGDSLFYRLSPPGLSVTDTSGGSGSSPV